jgi:TRAP-type C4-dicarboxylate transport system permease large subunit
VNLFAACAVANEPLLKVARPLLVFVGAVVVCLLLITYIPQISLILRDLVYR